MINFNINNARYNLAITGNQTEKNKKIHNYENIIDNFDFNN